MLLDRSYPRFSAIAKALLYSFMLGEGVLLIIVIPLEYGEERTAIE